MVGSSGSGKSTLAAELAERMGAPLVELDALNWKPGWKGLNETDPSELERLIGEGTEGDRWVVAGSYLAFSQKIFWPKLEVVIWLDLPRGLLLRRVFRRSWRRWRKRELLWGTCYEQFWPQLQIWKREKSLLWWIWTQYYPQKELLLAAMSDPEWSHIRFIRLTSIDEVEKFREKRRCGMMK